VDALAMMMERGLQRRFDALLEALRPADGVAQVEAAPLRRAACRYLAFPPGAPRLVGAHREVAGPLWRRWRAP
jgi:hypothetical protein